MAYTLLSHYTNTRSNHLPSEPQKPSERKTIYPNNVIAEIFHDIKQNVKISNATTINRTFTLTIDITHAVVNPFIKRVEACAPQGKII
jgi:hypothetical protein